MCLTALIFAQVERVVLATRLNELNTDDKQIDIDCFEFVKKFPTQLKLEHFEL